MNIIIKDYENIQLDLLYNAFQHIHTITFTNVFHTLHLYKEDYYSDQKAIETSYKYHVDNCYILLFLCDKENTSFYTNKYKYGTILIEKTLFSSIKLKLDKYLKLQAFI